MALKGVHALTTEPRAQRDALPPAAGSSLPRRTLLALMGGVMLGILLAALDATIVGPAMPRVIGELNGFERYAWVFTAYMLTSTIAVPIAGKLSDLYGRRPFFLGGIALFLLGSMLCGFAQTMDQLVLFRGLQGVGGGVIFANAFAIIGDVIPPAERGKWQGAFSSIWGFSSIVGPGIGGYLTDHLDWRWVFFVNLPVGLVALALITLTFPPLRSRHGPRSIDYLGAFTLVLGLTPLLLALSLGGTPGWEWTSTRVLVLLAASILALIAFLLVEARASEPIIPLRFFGRRIFAVPMAVAFAIGVGMFGAVSFIPLYLQGVMGDSAVGSGQALSPLMLAMVVASTLSGQIIARTGRYRLLAIGAGVAMTVAMALLAFTGTQPGDKPLMVAYMVLYGLGLGITLPLYTNVVQSAFPRDIGVVTASVQFFRQIGGAVGVAILGAVVNSGFRSAYLAGLSPALRARLSPETIEAVASPQALVSADSVRRLGDLLAAQVPAGAVDSVLAAVLAPMRLALASAIHQAFLLTAVVLAVGALVTLGLEEIPLLRGWAASPAPGRARPQQGEAGVAVAARASFDEPPLSP